MRSSVFGVPLEELVLSDAGIPSFLRVICDIIKKNSKIQGIFRVPGSQSLVDEMNVAFGRDEQPRPETIDVYSAASFLKQWLIYLPTPLLDPSIVNLFNTTKVGWFKRVLECLPMLNRLCTAAIFDVIEEVYNHREENQMNFMNLAICFCGSLTQNSKGLKYPFPFKTVCESAFRLLNKERVDFKLRGPQQQHSLQAFPRLRKGHGVSSNRALTISELFTEEPALLQSMIMSHGSVSEFSTIDMTDFAS